MALNVFSLLGFPPLLVIGTVFESYEFIYAILISFLLICTLMVRNYLRIFIFFMTFYLSIGLLNISTWRGYTTVETIVLYAWVTYLILAPILVLSYRQIDIPFQMAHQQRLLKLVIVGHLTIAFLTVSYVYISIGNVFSQQILRFQLPTALEYTIKSVLPIAAVLPFLRIRWPLIWIFAILLPPVMIGSRGTAVIGIVAYVIVLLHRNGGKLDLRSILKNSRALLLYALASIGIISLLFHLRRMGDGAFAAVDVIIDVYFDYDNIFIRAILPFYLGFKETIGLTTKIINDQVENVINPYPLFFADLLTVLPGENLAAGQSLSRLFGATQDGGLTPGLLGGLYIDYGSASVVVYGIIGVLLSFMQRSVRSSPYFMIVYAQLLTQLIHLFHRGFIKPEYVTSILIAYFYFILCHRVHVSLRETKQGLKVP